MRADIGPVVKMCPGDVARIHIKLPKGCKHGRVSLWTRYGPDDDFGPYVSYAAASAVSNEPQLLSTLKTFVNEDKPKALLTVIAEETYDLQVKQEKDLHTDPAVLVRVSKQSRRMVAFVLAVKGMLRKILPEFNKGKGNQDVRKTHTAL